MVPQRWFIDPTHVGPVSQKKHLFSHGIFSHFLILNPTDFCIWIEGQTIVAHAKS